MKSSRILITPGEPAGIGPDVLIKAAQQSWNAQLIAITDPVVLTERAAALNLPLNITECDLAPQDETLHQAGTLRVHPVTFPARITAGELNIQNAQTVLLCLQLAASACLNHQAQAIVTGPVHKGVMNDAGIRFSGHTEFFADAVGAEQTIMLFVVDKIKAALLTTHLPLKDVPAAVTHEKILSVLTLLHHELKKYFHLHTPRILVAGLNPHAGEGGHLGREELEIIAPALEQLRQQGLHIEGPLPADTIFTPAHLRDADAVLGMYHDQILPVIKHIGFDRAVNMTLGLPFVRTSVDHGTALDLAATGLADSGSMMAAIELAINSAQDM